MKKNVAFLRGINVSGKRKILMAELREQLEGIGLQSVQTYIQSGNIVFESKLGTEKLAKLIREMIFEKYGFEVPTLVKTKSEIEEILKHEPFLGHEQYEEKALYFTMLAEQPHMELVSAIDRERYAPELFVLKGSNIYYFAAKGYGKAKMNNNFFESKLKVQATTRNLKTMRKMKEMLAGN